MCEAGVQGSNRLQRGLLYMAYLRDLWSGFEPKVFTASFGHDDTAFYASAPFNEVAWAL